VFVVLSLGKGTYGMTRTHLLGWMARNSASRLVGELDELVLIGQAKLLEQCSHLVITHVTK
jgi:hypothetical protein